MTERNESLVVVGGNRSKDPKKPWTDVARSPTCVRDHPGSESDSDAESKIPQNLLGARPWVEAARRRMALHRAEHSRERARQRVAMRRAKKKARQLKRRLDDATRKEVDACAARWKRRLVRQFFDSRRLVLEKDMSERDMLKKHATSRDLHRMVVIVAEFEISIIEGMAEHGSIENYFKGLKIAAEFDEEGPKSNSTPVQTDEVLAKEDANGLLLMDIQKVDVDGSSGVECFRVDDFMW